MDSMVMVSSFLDLFLIALGSISHPFLSDFSDPVWCNHYGLHVSNHRKDGYRPRKNTGKHNDFETVFSFGQAGNTQNYSPSFAVPYAYGIELVYTLGSAYGYNHFWHFRYFSIMG
jgi:hypothetical protein